MTIFPLKSTVLAASLAWLASSSAGLAESDSSGFRVGESAITDGVALSVSSPYNTEFTTTLTCTLENAKSSVPLPLTVDSAGRQSVPLVEITRIDRALPWKYTYQYRCKRGARRTETGNPYAYALPFPPQSHLAVLQGHLGRFSHFEGSQDENAVDWTAPEGTTVCAARAGVVTGVRQDSTEGGTDPKYKTMANYIVLKHEDGTFAEYLHIGAHQALVTLGAKVTEGQPIARSGNTGFSSRPHIHFAVFQTVDGNTRLTLPCRFKAHGTFFENPQVGKAY